MAQSGPSAHEVANAVRYNTITSLVKLKDPQLYQEIKSGNQKILFINILITLVLIIGHSYGLYLAIAHGKTRNLIEISVASWILAFLIQYLLPSIIFSSGRSPKELLDAYETKEQIKADKASKDIEMASRRINEQDYLKLGISIITGNIGSNNNIVIGHKTSSTYKKIESEDPGLANAIAILTGFVEEQKSPTAAEALQNLVNEIQGQKIPSRLRAFWNDLIKILPDAAKLTTAAATISKLFDS